MEELRFLTICLIGGTIMGFIGYHCAHRTRRTAGFWLSFCFGPLGIIIACLLRPHESPAAAPTAQRPPAPAPRPDMPALPDLFTLRRGTDIFGPYTLDELTDHIRDGLIHPTDQYRTPAGHWALLARTGLV